MIELTEECSSRVMSKLLKKLEDPRIFSLLIRESDVRNPLCDLGTNINLIPLTEFKALGLGEPLSTSITLLLKEKPHITPDGIVEDLLIKI